MLQIKECDYICEWVWADCVFIDLRQAQLKGTHSFFVFFLLAAKMSQLLPEKLMSRRSLMAGQKTPCRTDMTSRRTELDVKSWIYKHRDHQRRRKRRRNQTENKVNFRNETQTLIIWCSRSNTSLHSAMFKVSSASSWWCCMSQSSSWWQLIYILCILKFSSTTVTSRYPPTPHWCPTHVRCSISTRTQHVRPVTLQESSHSKCTEAKKGQNISHPQQQHLKISLLVLLLWLQIRQDVMCSPSNTVVFMFMFKFSL